MQEVMIKARPDVTSTRVIRTVTNGLVNVRHTGDPVYLPLSNLAAVRQQCPESDYIVEVVSSREEPPQPVENAGSEDHQEQKTQSNSDPNSEKGEEEEDEGGGNDQAESSGDAEPQADQSKTGSAKGRKSPKRITPKK